MKRIFWIFLTALLLIGCNTSATTLEPTRTLVVETETPIPVNITDTPTSSFAETMAANQTQNAAHEVTRNALSTELAYEAATNVAKTPSPTSTPLGGIDLQGVANWLSESSDELLMTFSYKLRDDFYSLVIVNPKTGELFELPLPINIDKYFWAEDGNVIGLMTDDLSETIEINLSKGKLTEVPTTETMLRFLNPVTKTYLHFPIGIIKILPEDSETPFFVYFSHQWKVSRGGTYIVPENALDNFDYTPVENLKTGDLYEISYPEYSSEYLAELRKNNSYAYVSVEWSPFNNLLGILSQNTFRVYDVERQNQIAKYDDLSPLLGTIGDIASVKWSPNGKRILYGTGESEYADSTACIFELETGETSCLNKIRNYYGPIFIGNFQWSPDGSQISYVTYIQDYSVDNFLERGDLCVYDLMTQQIECITEEIEFLDHQAILDYEWSPNGNYIAYIADQSCPGCDFSTKPEVWIISMDGSQNLFVASSAGAFFDIDLLWRK